MQTSQHSRGQQSIKILEALHMDYTGTKTYTVINTQGKELGKISFNPLDASVLVRYKEAFANMSDMLAPLGGISITAEGTADTIADTAVLQVIEDKFRNALDSVFGEGTYSSFFSEVRPFAAKDGTFYSVSVIQHISKLIQQEVGNAANELEAMGYTGKKQKRKCGFFKRK